jgi:hypothetical protein
MEKRRIETTSDDGRSDVDLNKAMTTTKEQPRTRTERGDIGGTENTATTTTSRTPASGDNVPLFAQESLEDYRGRWDRVQVAFVDEPREAVQQAHDLVAEMVERLTRRFMEQRDQLEGTWSRGGDVSTEDLRQAMQRYRSFFNRLLST